MAVVLLNLHERPSRVSELTQGRAAARVVIPRWSSTLPGRSATLPSLLAALETRTRVLVILHHPRPVSDPKIQTLISRGPPLHRKSSDSRMTMILPLEA